MGQRQRGVRALKRPPRGPGEGRPWQLPSPLMTRCDCHSRGAGAEHRRGAARAPRRVPAVPSAARPLPSSRMTGGGRRAPSRAQRRGWERRARAAGPIPPSGETAPELPRRPRAAPTARLVRASAPASLPGLARAEASRVAPAARSAERRAKAEPAVAVRRPCRQTAWTDHHPAARTEWLARRKRTAALAPARTDPARIHSHEPSVRKRARRPAGRSWVLPLGT